MEVWRTKGLMQIFGVEIWLKRLNGDKLTIQEGEEIIFHSYVYMSC